MIEIYLIFMILGLVLLVIFAALGGFGGDADFDVGDADMDLDIDMGHDIDLGDGGHDIDFGDVDGHDVDLGDVDGHDVDLSDIDSADHDVTHMNPVSLPNILIFMTSFGTIGTLLTSIGMNDRVIPFISAGVSIVIAAGVFLVMERVFAATESTSLVQMHKLIGLEAKVSVPIKKGREGQVEVIRPEGGMMLMGALADENIPINTIVVIKAIKGDVAKVRKAGKKKETTQQAVMKMQKKGTGGKSTKGAKKGAKRK